MFIISDGGVREDTSFFIPSRDPGCHEIEQSLSLSAQVCLQNCRLDPAKELIAPYPRCGLHQYKHTLHQHLEIEAQPTYIGVRPVSSRIARQHDRNEKYLILLTARKNF